MLVNVDFLLLYVKRIPVRSEMHNQIQPINRRKPFDSGPFEDIYEFVQ